MPRSQMIWISIALLIIAGFLTLYSQNLMSEYGTGFTDHVFNDGKLRDKINLLYKCRVGASMLGAAGLVCAFFGIGVEKPEKAKSKE